MYNTVRCICFVDWVLFMLKIGKSGLGFRRDGVEELV